MLKVAQLVERRIVAPIDTGSSPAFQPILSTDMECDMFELISKEKHVAEARIWMLDGSRAGQCDMFDVNYKVKHVARALPWLSPPGLSETKSLSP